MFDLDSDLSFFGGRGEAFIYKYLLSSYYVPDTVLRLYHRRGGICVKCRALQGGCCWDLKCHRPLGAEGEKGKITNLKDGTRWQV